MTIEFYLHPTVHHYSDPSRVQSLDSTGELYVDTSMFICKIRVARIESYRRDLSLSSLIVLMCSIEPLLLHCPHASLTFHVVLDATLGKRSMTEKIAYI